MSTPDIFLSHDWPQGIEHQGNLKRLLQKKKFFKADIDKVFLSLIFYTPRACHGLLRFSLFARYPNNPLRFFQFKVEHLSTSLHPATYTAEPT
jgi:hypothetical protein